MLLIREYYKKKYRNLIKFIFKTYNIPQELELCIYEYIDIYRYLYDNVVFDIDMGIHTTQVFYNIKKNDIPKLTAFGIPETIRDNIVCYRDIYIPINSLLQLNEQCLDNTLTSIILKFNNVYKESTLEKLRYIEQLKDKLNNKIISKEDYEKLNNYILFNYDIDIKDCNKLQYITLTETYILSKDKIDNLILRNNTDPMTICNNCDKRFKLSKNLSKSKDKNIAKSLKDPYLKCDCTNNS